METRILEYLADQFKRHSSMMILQRRDVIVTNGEFCLRIDLVTRENKHYNCQLDYEVNYCIIESEWQLIN